MPFKLSSWLSPSKSRETSSDSDTVMNDNEILDLSDSFLDRLHMIERDSSESSPGWPDLNEEAILKVASKITDEDAISLVFLLTNDADQAYAVCQKIDAKKFTQPGKKTSAAASFFEVMISTARKRQLRPGWHLQLFLGLHLIGRLKPLFEEMGQIGHIVYKSREYDDLVEKLKLNRFLIREEARLRLFELCISLDSKEAADLYICLKAYQANPNPSPVDKDAAVWSNPEEKIPSKPLELWLLELMVKDRAVDLLDKIRVVLPQIVHLPPNEFNERFGPVFGTIVTDDTSNWNAPIVPPSLPGISSDEVSLKKGTCLIINNQKFESGEFTPREGSEWDERELKKLWEAYSCDVIVKRDLKGEEMWKVLDKFRDQISAIGSRWSSTSEKASTYFSVVCILSHGRRVNNVDEVVGVDGVGIPTDDVTDLIIDGDKCPGMVGKIKLFFIQACRGNEGQRGANVVRPPFRGGAVRRRGDDVVADGAFSFPSKSQYIIANSTIQGFVSYRSRKEGSFFIQAICEEFPKYSKYKDLLNLFNYVNKEMDQELSKRDQKLRQCAVLTCGGLYGTIYLPKLKQ